MLKLPRLAPPTRPQDSIWDFGDAVDLYCSRRIDAEDIIGRSIASHDDRFIGLREAVRAMGKLVLAIALVAWRRALSGRLTNGMPHLV